MAPRDEERRLAAVMFADIVGYTRLMATDEETGVRARRRHREIARPLVESYRGRWVEERGDESLSVFRSALDAVNCAAGSALATGVVDLLILPSGELLVMERHLGSAFAFPLVVPFFRITIAQVFFGGATDVSSLPGLAGAAFVPVAKTVLWQDDVGLTNFESMALGPQLARGDYSLLLLAEGGAVSGDPVLRSLRVTPAPEPRGWLLGTAALCTLWLLRPPRPRRAPRDGEARSSIHWLLED